MMPTADHVALAVIAACRETGEDPLSIATEPTLRARHYAMHALLSSFDDLTRSAAARMVGAPGNPAVFWTASWNQVVKTRASGDGHMARWFDDDAFGRVIDAIPVPPKKKPEPPRQNPPPYTPSRMPTPYKPGPLPTTSYRPPVDTLRKALEDESRPVFDRGKAPVRKVEPKTRTSSKQQMLDDLAKAVANTAALKAPKD